MAIGLYSRDIWGVSCAEWVRDRDLGLMAYIYIRQTWPAFDFDSGGTYSTALWDYSETVPWLNNTACPKWVEEQITQNKAALNRAHEYQEDLLKYHGDLLKSVRIKENLSQLQFAEIIHIKQSELSEIEDGKRSLSKEIAKRVQEAFGPDYRFFDI